MKRGLLLTFSTLLVIILAWGSYDWGYDRGMAAHVEQDALDPPTESTHTATVHVHTQTREAVTPAPTVAITATKDSKSGWNIQLTTTNFTFAPENVGSTHTDGQGHAHVYVDGVKVARLYGNWYHLDNLTTGHHTVTATLNANDHADYTVQGKKVESTVTITQE